MKPFQRHQKKKKKCRILKHERIKIKPFVGSTYKQIIASEWGFCLKKLAV